MKDSQIDKWLQKNLSDLLIEIKQKLQKGSKAEKVERFSFYESSCGGFAIVYKYFMAYFQDQYRLVISYEDGQVLSFYEKENHEMENTYELFPPMMFCEAASDRSRQYICSAKSFNRRGITVDHPFVIWLLNNVSQLNKYYQRQFQQIIDCLCENDANDIVKECNRIREQLVAFSEHHGVDVISFPQLSMGDFWSVEEE